MKELIPLDAYDSGVFYLRLRFRVVSGFAFGASMGCIFGAVWWFFTLVGLEFPPLLSPPIVGLMTAAFTGIGFGYLFPRGMQQHYRALQTKGNSGESPFATRPPDGEIYDFRLACCWKKSMHKAVGSHLYIGSRTLVFVPHKLNNPGEKIVIRIPLEGTTYNNIAQDATFLQRLVVGGPPMVLQVSSAGNDWKFLVPCPERVKEELRAHTGAVARP